MKLYSSFILLFLMASCKRPQKDVASLQSRIDSLQIKLGNSYKPGLGEFMTNIQIHHAKLWFAGMAGNWKLSDFETKEIIEAIDGIQTYCSDRPEVKSVSMIKPALDSVTSAIKNKNLQQFKITFISLTNTCNNCHRVTKHEFNLIKIPAEPPFSNQSFQDSGK